MSNVITKIKSDLFQKKKDATIFLNKLYNSNNFEKEVYVVSFPKSGRTWLRLMLLEINIRLSFDHAGSGVNNELADYNTNDYRNRKVIFLARDPRDVAVPSYFQTTKRKETYDGRYRNGIKDLIRDEKYGLKKIITYYGHWYNHMHTSNDFLLLKYEDLHSNAVEQLENLLTFIGKKGIDQTILQEAVDTCRFENMHKREKEGYYKNYGEILKPGDPGDPESFKTRKGKVGGYIDYLDESDIDYCNGTIQELQYAWYSDHK